MLRAKSLHRRELASGDSYYDRNKIYTAWIRPTLDTWLQLEVWVDNEGHRISGGLVIRLIQSARMRGVQRIEFVLGY